MRDAIGRREALRRLAGGGALLAGSGLVTGLRSDRGVEPRAGTRANAQVRSYQVGMAPARPVLAVARSVRDEALLTRRAIDALGGMSRFISRGDVVVIKPNIGWDRLPMHAANTNPRVVAELVRMAFEAGASRVVVADVSCNDPARCYQRSGIWQATHELGATVLLPAAHRFRPMRLGGELLHEWPIFVPLVEADKVINAPVAKHHGLCRYSGAMKNWYGLLGGRRNRLHQSIDRSITDLASFIRPTLTVLDENLIRVFNAPQGGNLDDTRETYQVIASVDQVAVDAYGTRLIGARPEQVGYLRLGAERGLGSYQLDQVPLVEV